MFYGTEFMSQVVLSLNKTLKLNRDKHVRSAVVIETE